MSTTYNGVAGNVSLASGVSITIPQDGVDTLGASSVNVTTQKEADYIEALRQQQASVGRMRSGAISAHNWVGVQTGSLPGNDICVLLNPAGNGGSISTTATFGPDVTHTSGQNRLNAINAGTYRVWVGGPVLYNSGAGGQTELALMKNGSTTLFAKLGLMSTTAAAALYSSTEIYVSLAANDYVGLAFVSHAGGTGAYNVYVSTLFSTSSYFFGMERVA